MVAAPLSERRTSGRDRKQASSIYTDQANDANKSNKKSTTTSDTDNSDSNSDSDSDDDNFGNDENKSMNTTLISRPKPSVSTIKKANKPANAKKPTKAKATKAKSSKQSLDGTLSTTSNANATVLQKHYKNEQNYLLKTLLTATPTSLTTAATSVIDMHAPTSQNLNASPNVAHIKILNLIFRAVGGTIDSEIPSDGTVILDDLSDDEWIAYVTKCVSDMQGEDAGAVLMGCGKGGKGGGRFGKGFEAFFVKVCEVGLSSSSSSKNADSDDDSSENSDDADIGMSSTLSLDLVRNLLTRITELVAVGQPDIRYAASLAAFSMSKALLSKINTLTAKLAVSKRQHNAAGKGARKTALKTQVDGINRGITNVTELLTTQVYNVVFMHRYRDSNEYIRSLCLEALSNACVTVPKVFFNDGWLKYFGWMLHDESATVRIAALDGLNLPFVVAESNTDNGIDLSILRNVSTKFVKRISECCIDVSSSVQVHAVTLLLSLLREGFLDTDGDDGDDGEGADWEQINFRAIDPRASKEVRRASLLFIIEQLEAFDGDDDAGDKDKDSAEVDSETKVVLKLDSLASWLAHALIPPSTPNFDLKTLNLSYVDYCIQSLRSLPPLHSRLATNWSALLRCITEDNVAVTSGNETAGGNVDVAKQRVLVRMLMAAVKLEVGSDGIAGATTSGGKKKTTTATAKASMEHTTLSVSLLRALPPLFTKFISDNTILLTLSALPRYLTHSCFSLPQLKPHIVKLLKCMAELYMRTSDVKVMGALAGSMGHCMVGGHARVEEGRGCVLRVVEGLVEKVGDLASLTMTGDDGDGGKAAKTTGKKRKSSSSTTATHDSEYSLALTLKQLRVLGKQIDISSLMSDDDVDSLIATICECARTRITSISASADNRMMKESGEVVCEGLGIGLEVLAWRVAGVHDGEDGKGIDDDDNDEGDDESDDKDGEDGEGHLVVRLRNSIIELCQAAFKMDIVNVDSDKSKKKSKNKKVNKNKNKDDDDEDSDDDSDSDSEEEDEQTSTQNTILTKTVQTVSDLRTLCAKALTTSSSSILRSLALTSTTTSTSVDIKSLITGCEKYMKTTSQSAYSNGNDVDVNTALLPLARNVLCNWASVNKKEAGVVLTNLNSDGGDDAEKAVTSLMKLVKTKDCVRLLEAHMAALRGGFEEWLLLEVEPLLVKGGGKATRKEKVDHEKKERKHEEMYGDLQMLGLKLSNSLGITGKKGKKGKQQLLIMKKETEKMIMPLVGFCREGIRWGLSCKKDKGSELQESFGERIAFLGVIKSHLTLLKKSSSDGRDGSEMDEMLKELEERVDAFEGHIFYEEEVHGEALRGYVEDFRRALEGGEKKGLKKEEEEDFEDENEDQNQQEEKKVVGGKRKVRDENENEDEEDDFADESPKRAKIA